MADALSLFDELMAARAAQRLPPVDQWQPARSGRIDIRISADGRWWHEGGEIRRPEMVRLFASILRRDADGFVLVTPAERLLIDVEDAPFLAGDMEVRGPGEPDQLILFSLNVGDLVLLDAEHPLSVSGSAAAPRPYVEARPGLLALLSRPVYYRLAELAEAMDDTGQRYRVRSAGLFFPLQPEP